MKISEQISCSNFVQHNLENNTKYLIENTCYLFQIKSCHFIKCVFNFRYQWWPYFPPHLLLEQILAGFSEY